MMHASLGITVRNRRVLGPYVSLYEIATSETVLSFTQISIEIIKQEHDFVCPQTRQLRLREAAI